MTNMTKEHIKTIIEDAKAKGDIATIEKIKSIIQKQQTNKTQEYRQPNDDFIAPTKRKSIVPGDVEGRQCRREKIDLSHRVNRFEDDHITGKEDSPEQLELLYGNKPLVPRNRNEFQSIDATCIICRRNIYNIHPSDYQQRLGVETDGYVCDRCIARR